MASKKKKTTKKSKKLADVRDGFVKYLNLPTLYNFAISRDMVK